MRGFFRKKIMPSLYWFFNNEGLNLVVYVLILYFIIKNIQGFQEDMIDLTIFMTLILALLINYLNIFLQNFFSKVFEDRWKLTTHYEALVAKYISDDYVVIDYPETPSNEAGCYSRQWVKNFKTFKKHATLTLIADHKWRVTFPIVRVEDPNLGGIELYILDDKDKQYQLPDLIQQQYDHIIGAHNTSKIYNQLNIRVDGWGINQNRIVMNTSRVTYYDALVTNRAMDFQWQNKTTTRENFNYGPLIGSLHDSQLANIFGFFGFVITADGYIPMIKRNKKVSKGKGVYAPSVSGSVKVKYALNHRGNFNTTGLQRALLKEIDDTLSIASRDLAPFNLETNIVSMFQDLIEGGKPGLLFYARTTQTKAQIQTTLKASMKEKGKRHTYKTRQDTHVLADPDNILWIHQADFQHLMIGLETIVHNNKVYQTLPPYAASLELFRRQLVSTTEELVES